MCVCVWFALLCFLPVDKSQTEPPVSEGAFTYVGLH